VKFKDNKPFWSVEKVTGDVSFERNSEGSKVALPSGKAIAVCRFGRLISLPKSQQVQKKSKTKNMDFDIQEINPKTLGNQR
jgi:hypothetical protein